MSITAVLFISDVCSHIELKSRPQTRSRRRLPQADEQESGVEGTFSLVFTGWKWGITTCSLLSNAT